MTERKDAVRVKQTRNLGMQKIGMRKTLALTAMVLPGAIWLLLIRYVPMFGVLMAFKDFKLPNPRLSILSDIFSRNWVGFKNFETLFTSPKTFAIIRNTLGYNLLFIILGLIIAVAFAIMLNEVSNKLVAKTYQTLMFFPYFISWVVVSYFLWAFISDQHGLIDAASFGLTSFYQNPEPWPFLLIIANIWKLTGYSTILYLASITGIDATEYEAASIDGATKWQQVVHVTLPHLRNIIVILFIMNIGRIFNADFGLFWQLPMGGGTGRVVNVTEVVDTYVYRVLRDPAAINIGMSTAVGLFQNFVGFICIMAANTVVRKVDPESSLF